MFVPHTFRIRYYTQRKRKTSQFVLNREIYERMHILITEELKLTDIRILVGNRIRSFMIIIC
jgi:hypothetical protein